MNTNGINNLQSVLLQQVPAAQKPANDSASATVNISHAGSDQTSLSPASTLLAQALTTSDVRADKVAALQQAIASGSYTISSSDVADKMVNSLLE